MKKILSALTIFVASIFLTGVVHAGGMTYTIIPSILSVPPSPLTIQNTWYFYNDTADTATNLESSPLREFTLGPSIPPLGEGSVSFDLSAANDRWNIATNQFAGMQLSTLPAMSFDMYVPASSTGGTTTTLYLNFDVDFDGSTPGAVFSNYDKAAGAYQNRLVYLPPNNGTVTVDTWQSWNAWADDAKWSWSGFVNNSNKWPDGNTNELRTKAELITAFPNLAVWNEAGVGGQFLIRAGHPGPVGLKGSVDKIIFGNSGFNFEKTAAPTVHIFKYIDGVQATPVNASGVNFPMFTSTYNAPFTLGPSGWTTGDEPYEASTSPMTLGASYSAEEKLDTSLVGVTCDGTHEYALLGYGIGDTKESAVAVIPNLDIPNLTNLQGDKYIIVNNHKCPPVSTIKVHILKYLDGHKATNVPGGYQFPMSASWNASNLGSGTGSYVLGANWGGAVDTYGADTSSMNIPADYSTYEVTDGTSKVLPIGTKCSPGLYRLKGYKSSSLSFLAAAFSPLKHTAPTFTGLTSDKYVLVMNETCPTGPTSKDECKKDGWKSFTNPTFRNQGECVSYVEHHDDRGDDDKDEHHEMIERYRREALERLHHIMDSYKNKNH